MIFRILRSRPLCKTAHRRLSRRICSIFLYQQTNAGCIDHSPPMIELSMCIPNVTFVLLPLHIFLDTKSFSFSLQAYHFLQLFFSVSPFWIIPCRISPSRLRLAQNYVSSRPPQPIESMDPKESGFSTREEQPGAVPMGTLLFGSAKLTEPLCKAFRCSRDFPCARPILRFYFLLRLLRQSPTFPDFPLLR
ncbi:hypothetical protein DdX_12696 [Ditylenchus destructor]|uniref:Uncharacterized protein n=1 Tax=Ditylenchus destructor TaxID=166010 RepID=A0AAD4R048_9BILA|nr:hypothetical protein DdX_12696 [Ditylenchus destructor]